MSKQQKIKLPSPKLHFSKISLKFIKFLSEDMTFYFSDFNYFRKLFRFFYLSGGNTETFFGGGSTKKCDQALIKSSLGSV